MLAWRYRKQHVAAAKGPFRHCAVQGHFGSLSQGIQSFSPNE